MPQQDQRSVLVVGGGGREHALAWAIANSPDVDHVFVAPGNGGTALEQTLENVPIGDGDIDGLLAFASERRVGLTVVGPEKPLAAGITDRFGAAGMPVFGPTRAAARLETSKVWAREFMRRHGVPHPRFVVADNPEAAEQAVRAMGGRCAVKADGLAAGKGVIVCDRVDEAVAAVRAMLIERAFGEAGSRVLVEARADGPELSVMAVTDGTESFVLPPAQDHKRLQDGDLGPNTGGMGAYAPAPIATPELMEEVRRDVIEPTLRGMASEGTPFRGCLYCGLMLTDDGPVVIEYNARFGDPETQAQLPLLGTDLFRLLAAAAGAPGAPSLTDVARAVAPVSSHAVCVVLAARGYPVLPQTGQPIEGLAVAESVEGVKVFHAGTRLEDGPGAGLAQGADGRSAPRVLSSGGRVLNVVCVRPDLAAAAAGAYAAIGDDADPGRGVRFEGMEYRSDIAARALEGGRP